MEPFGVQIEPLIVSVMLVPRRRPGTYVELPVRRIILYQHTVLRWSSAAISVATDIPLRTVQRIIHRWDVMGQIIQNPRREGPPKLLTEVELTVSAINPELICHSCM